MKRVWRKLGLLYSPLLTQKHPKLISHASNPLAVHLYDDVYRVFYSGRDAFNRSSVGGVDIDILKQKIVKDYYEPFFVHGPKGSFFADGVSIGNCYEVNGVCYMLFMGWQSPEGEQWRGDIGRLVVSSENTLSLESSTPFIGSDVHNPISLSYPWVKKHSNNDYEMWYGSTTTWDAGNQEMIHVINHATSNDGHNWQHRGLSIPYEIGEAQAFSRPSVIAEDVREMWFSYRGGSEKKYRIGYAKADKNQDWQLLLDDTGIDVSSSGWDSEMIEYPFVFEHKNKKYMLYNGNDYGKTGFGLAVFEKYSSELINK